MSKYSDIVNLLDWALAQKKKETETVQSRPKKTPDVIEMLQKKRREVQELETFIKELEKLNKKEEKKEGPFNKLTTTQLTIIMVVTVPIYLVLLMKLLT